MLGFRDSADIADFGVNFTWIVAGWVVIAVAIWVGVLGVQANATLNEIAKHAARTSDGVKRLERAFAP